MERKNNESFVQYIRRVIQAVEDKEIDYEEFGDALLEADNVYSSDNLRKALYVLRKLLPKLEEDTEIECDNLEELAIMKDEIYKERVKLRDERRELNKLLTLDARYDNLVDCLKEAVKKLPDVQSSSEYVVQSQGDAARLLLSDWHLGADIDNMFNRYNMEIAKERMETLRAKVVEYCIKHKVKELGVYILGDMVDGIIHTSSRVAAEEDVITQIIVVSEMLSQLIMDLKKVVPQVKVLVVSGNHARVTPNKEASIGRENFERLIEEFIRLRTNGVTILSGYGNDFIQVQDNGENIVCVHGHNDKQYTMVKDLSTLFKTVPDAIYAGHYHTFMNSNDNDVNIVVNGSFCGADDYAVSLRKCAKPMQTLIIDHGDDEIIYKISL